MAENDVASVFKLKSADGSCIVCLNERDCDEQLFVTPEIKSRFYNLLVYLRHRILDGKPNGDGVAYVEMDLCTRCLGLVERYGPLYKTYPRVQREIGNSVSSVDNWWKARQTQRSKLWRATRKWISDQTDIDYKFSTRWRNKLGQNILARRKLAEKRRIQLEYYMAGKILPHGAFVAKKVKTESKGYGYVACPDIRKAKIESNVNVDDQKDTRKVKVEQEIELIELD